MADIFVSYKSERRNAAQHLKRIFELSGYTVWFDYGLLTGRDFARQIEQELAAAKAVVVLWCSRSVNSDWVINEAHYAKEHGRFIPVWIEKASLPFGFQRDDTINLIEWDASPRSPDLDRLFDQIASLVGRDPTPDRKGLREYETNWKMFGAPSLATFALDKDLEAERAQREEEERQRKAEEDVRLKAEEDANKRERAEQERRAEELARLAAVKLQAEADERAKQAQLLAQQRAAALQAQKDEQLRLEQQAEAERRIRDEEERRQREAVEERRIEQRSHGTLAADNDVAQPATLPAADATTERPTLEELPAAISKPSWTSNPTVRYSGFAVMILIVGATIAILMGITNSSPEDYFRSGFNYEYGHSGYPRDEQKAIDMYTNASDLGHEEATLKLAQILENSGDKTEKDLKKAIFYYKKIAHQSFSARAALSRLGVKYP